MDTRLNDYLDDKLQSAADLDTLDVLLGDVQKQQDLLKKQLETARREHELAKEETRRYCEAVQQQAVAFQAEQADIDRRLLTVTQSDASDDAIGKFEASLQKIHQLGLATKYIELLTEVDNIRSITLRSLEQSVDAAIHPYRDLQALVARLRPLQDIAEGAAPHLVDHIVSVVDDLRQRIQRAASDKLATTLKKLHWPKLTETVPLALQNEWSENIIRLLNLQMQDLLDRQAANAHQQVKLDDPPVLLPFQVLVSDLEQRFTYHFSGTKPTNRLDKPEYFLNHVIDLIAEYAGFVEDSIQPILFRSFRGTSLASTPAYIDATCAYITALLPMVKEKLYNLASQLKGQPPLLSHLVQEAIKFDGTLQESYEYAPDSPSVLWRGLSYFLLETCGYFDSWLSAEREFALSRYHAIIEASDAGELDYDAVSADAVKPTKAAIRVNDLLETVTERYKRLSSFSQKIRFLMEVQIQIFDQYFQRLRSGLEAFIAMTSTVGRTMHTITREEMTEVQGVKGLDRLCRIFGSAAFLEHAMRDWSDDVFFLELWAELDYRAKNRAIDSSRLKSSWADIQQRTSSALGGAIANNTDAPESSLEGALFDETATSYRRIRTRSESVLVDRIKDGIRQALKPYAGISTWASLGSAAGGDSTSPELESTLHLLNEYLGFLRGALGRAAMRRVTRQVCLAIQSALWDSVLVGRSFSTAGAAQLTADVRAICAGIDRHAGPGQAQAGMRKLLEGVTLLNLPVRGTDETNAADDETSAWDDDGDEKAKDSDMTQVDQRMSLFQAERLIFQNNEGARSALEMLGLETLSESDARAVLGKRVELAS